MSPRAKTKDVGGQAKSSQKIGKAHPSSRFLTHVTFKPPCFKPFSKPHLLLQHIESPERADDFREHDRKFFWSASGEHPPPSAVSYTIVNPH